MSHFIDICNCYNKMKCWKQQDRRRMNVAPDRTIIFKMSAMLLTLKQIKSHVVDAGFHRTQIQSSPYLVRASLSHCFCWDLTDVTLACEDHTTSQKVKQPLLALLYRILPNQTNCCRYWSGSFVKILKLSPAFTDNLSKLLRECVKVATWIR